MPMQYLHHNSPVEVERYVAEAVEMVERLDVPDDLRVEAFSRAVDLLSSKMAYGQPDTIPVAGRLIGPNGGLG